MKFDIKKFLVKSLELKEKEVSIFLLLFFHSFFLGWFIAFYFASANSVFIMHFGSEHLPYAYIVAGIAGYLVSSLYSFVQKRISTRALFSSALFFMLLVTLSGRFALHHISAKWLGAFMFIWAWPFISLTGIELGGLAIRFLNLIQVKRLYGLFNMGGVIAAILSYFTIPLLKPVIGTVYNYFYIGSLGLIASIYILFRLYKKFGSNEQRRVRVKEKHRGIKNLFKDKYILWIFLSATLSMTMIYLTDFGFLSSVKVNINPDNITQYLAIVFGALKVGELIISYYSRRLLTNYGVKLGLTILPITSTLVILIAAIWGLSFGTGMVFLILMTLMKSLERILRRGLDDPAFNILYQPLEDNQKIAVQSRVGVVMQFSIALAGALLLGANTLLSHNGSFNLKFFPLFFLPILIIWVIVAINLYKSYKSKIRQILAKISKDKRRGTDQYQYGSEILRKHLNDDNFFSVSFSTTVLSEMNPKMIEAYASNLIKKHKNPYFLKVILHNIDPTWRRRLAKNIDNVLKNELPADVEKIAQHARENLDYSGLQSSLSEAEAMELLNSAKTKDRLLLIKYIHKHIFKPTEEILLKLLEDKEKIVKISVINLSSSFKTERVIKKIAAYLKDVEYRHIAANTLLDLGGRVLPILDEFFKTPDTDVDILLKIIEIYGKIGTKDAQNLLLKHLNYPNRDIQIAVIFALFYCKYQANEEQKPFIQHKLGEIIDNILWIYATMLDIEGQHNTLKLFLALDLEKEFYFDIIFLLLSFLYEPRIITLVQKNIVGKDTIFALEIMDNFFDSDIKKLITPIFDDITPAQKIKRLSYMFPQKRLSLVERLKDIILQDYSRLDPWTIAKAIELLGKLHKKKVTQRKSSNSFIDYSDIKIWRKDKINQTLEKIRRSEIPDEVFIALYHTNELIYTTAAKIIFEENPIKCFDYLANMSPKKQKLMQLLSNNEMLIDEKIKYIKRFHLFFNLPDNLIPLIAKISEIIILKKDKFINIYDKNKERIFLIINGTLSYRISENEKKIFAKNDIIIRGINIDNFATKLQANSDLSLIAFDRIEFFNVIISNKEIVRHILSEAQQLTWIID
jgi:predicted MFS family arabinose efflux permease